MALQGQSERSAEGEAFQQKLLLCLKLGLQREGSGRAASVPATRDHSLSLAVIIKPAESAAGRRHGRLRRPLLGRISCPVVQRQGVSG